MTLVKLQRLPGNRISKIFRIFYVHKEAIDLSDGDLELVFENGAVARLWGNDARHDTLVVEETPWEDPFKPPLSTENSEYVRRSGKWTRIDTSAEQPYSSFIGADILTVDPVLESDGNGAIVGCHIATSRGVIEALVELDQLHVKLLPT